MSAFNIFNLVNDMAPEKSKELIEFILTYGRRTNYERDAVVVNEGDVSDSVLIILDGIVEVLKEEVTGEKIIIAQLGKGSIIGEMGIFLNKKRSATIKAKTDIVAAKFTYYAFLTAASQLPELMLRLLKSLSQKLDDMSLKFAQTIDSKLLFVVGLYIIEKRKGTAHDRINVALDIQSVMKETGLEEYKIYTAINKFSSLKIIDGFSAEKNAIISFDVDIPEMLKYLKSISYV